MSNIDQESNYVESSAFTSVEDVLLKLLIELEHSTVEELDLSVLEKNDDYNAIHKSFVAEENILRQLEEEYLNLEEEYRQIPNELIDLKAKYHRLTLQQSELNAADPFDTEVINRLQEINTQIQDVLQEARPFTSRLSEIEKRASQIKDFLVPAHQNNLHILEKKLEVLVVLERFSSLKYHLTNLNKQGGISLSSASLARALASLHPKKETANALTDLGGKIRPVPPVEAAETQVEELSTNVIEALLFKLLASTEEESEFDLEPSKATTENAEDAEAAIDRLLTRERPAVNKRDWRGNQSKRIIKNWKEFYVGYYDTVEDKRIVSLTQTYRDLVEKIFDYEGQALSQDQSWLDYLETIVYTFELSVQDVNTIYNPNNALTASSVRKLISVFYRHQHSSFVFPDEFEILAERIRGGEWPADKKIGDIVQEVYPTASRKTQEILKDEEPTITSLVSPMPRVNTTYVHIPKEGEPDFVEVDTEYWKKFQNPHEEVEVEEENLSAIQEEILGQLKKFGEIARLRKLTRQRTFPFHIMLKVLDVDTKITHQLRTQFANYPEIRGQKDGEDEFSIVDIMIMMIVKKRNILTNTKALVVMYNAIRDESAFIRSEWKKLTQDPESA